MKSNLLKTLMFASKQTLYVFIVQVAAMQLLLANTSSSQSLKETKIAIHVKNVAIMKVFEVIESQTPFAFTYRKNTLGVDRYTFQHDEVSVEEVLNEISRKGNLEFHQVNNNISVIKSRTARPEPEVLGSTSENFIIHGQVLDEKGQPMPGATVMIKGTSVGTVTDANGNFTVSAPEGSLTLVVTFTGYKPKEVPIANNATITIELEPDVTTLAELVVIGYGQQDRKEVTTAIASFKPTSENARPVLGPDQVMQGRMPGVYVGAGAGTPGSAVRVSIRGIGSLSGENEPLYVVDGIPLANHNAAMFNLGEGMNPLAELNPNDIESIEVLKDAAAAAIYGSRATNGVVIITTKSGKNGVSRLDVTANFGVQSLPYKDKLKMAGSDLYVDVVNEAIYNYNTQYGYQPGNNNFVEYQTTPYPGLPDTDWLDQVLRTAITQNANVSFSSGTEKTKLYISAGYLDQEGVLKSNRFRKYNAKMNIQHNATSWLELSTNSTFSLTQNERIPNGDIGSSIMLRSMGQRPYDRPYKPNGEYYTGGTSELVYHNNLQILNEQDNQLDNYRYLGNFIADIRLTPYLHLKNSLGIDAVYTEDFTYYNANHPYGAGQGRILDERRMITNGLIENTLHFDKALGDLSVNALAGHSFQKVSTSTSFIDGRGFPSPSFDVISVASEIASASTGFGQYALESYYARTNFNWADKYLLSLSIRADGSSKFSPENRWGSFPSASIGWNVSNESFWFMDRTDLKIRGSYGTTGNQDGIGSYASQALMSGGTNYNNESGLSITTFGNPDLTWETAEQFDAGLDLSLFEGKVNVTADYFVKNTRNLLYSMPIHATSGFSSVTSNIGSMQNRGLEFLVNYSQNIGAVTWTTDFNISFIRNKLTALLGDEPLLIGANRTLQVGEEVGSFYMYRMLGIFQSDEDVPAPQFAQGVRAGDVHYEDVDDNGVINVDDRQIIGSSNPDFYGGWSNTFRYKNFDLSAFVTYAQGAEIYATWRITTDRLGSGKQGFREVEALNRWTGPGTSNDVPRAIYGSGHNLQNSSRFLEDASYIRLRSVTLGYSLPQPVLEKLHMARLRVYVQGDNLGLLTRYSGIDPEVSKNYDARYMSDDNMNLPQPRTISFGINAGF
jgi:TonB-dependent starch-binding outer membrane protein SusC